MPLKRKLPPPKKPASTKGGVDEFGLSIRERAFADYCLEGQAASAAYVKAGYTAKNDNVAGVSASRMLRKARVVSYMETRAKALRESLNITPERVLKEVARIAFLDPLELVDATGKFRPLAQMSEDARRAITDMEMDEKGNVVKVKASGKSAAQDKLMRWLRLYREVELPPPGAPQRHEVHLTIDPGEAYRRMLNRG